MGSNDAEPIKVHDRGAWGRRPWSGSRGFLQVPETGRVVNCEAASALAGELVRPFDWSALSLSGSRADSRDSDSQLVEV
jgi:hypothetical protein